MMRCAVNAAAASRTSVGTRLCAGWATSRNAMIMRSIGSSGMGGVVARILGMGGSGIGPPFIAANYQQLINRPDRRQGVVRRRSDRGAAPGGGNARELSTLVA